MKKSTARACAISIIGKPIGEGIRTWISLAKALDKTYECDQDTKAKNTRVARKRVESIIHKHITQTDITLIGKAKRDEDVGFYNTKAWQKVRYAALRKYGGKCQLCGRSYKEHGIVLNVDHIKPRSKYPDLELDENNLQVLCRDCNMGKLARDEIDWR